MPDDYTWADIQEIAELKKSGFQFDGQYRTNRYNMQKAGMDWADADRLSAAYANLTNPTGIATDPLTMLAEASMTLQKPFQAIAGGIASGRPIGEIALETLKAPFTTGRSYGEAGATGAGRFLSDMTFDPLWITGLGAARLVGKPGRAIAKIGTTGKDVAGGLLTKKVMTEAGETVTQKVETLSELLKTPADDLLFAGKKKGAAKVKRDTQSAYDTMSKEWMKANKGKKTAPPPIDHLVHSSPEKMVAASDLIDMGASGLATFGVGSRRFVPFKGTQAKIARGIEKHGKLSKRIFELDPSMRLSRSVRSSRLNKENISTLAGEEIEQILKGAGYTGRGVDLEDAEHMFESIGRLQEGGMGVGGSVLRDMDGSPEATLRVFNTLFRIVNPEVKKSVREANLGVAGVFSRAGMKDKGVRQLIDLPSGPYDLGPALSIARKQRDLRNAKRAAERAGDIAPDFDDFLQKTNVMDEIKSMAKHIFRVDEASKEWKLMESLGDMFMSTGKALVDAGALSRVHLGWLPRETTPGFKGLIDMLNKSGAVPRAKMSAVGQELSEHASFMKQRGWDRYTMSEIEDAFRRGEADLIGLGDWNVDKLSDAFKSQVGISGWNQNWARFMGLFGKREFLSDVSKADPELARVFFADPAVFATMNRAKWSRVLNARDHIKFGVEHFASDIIEKGAKEGTAPFYMRVRGEIAKKLNTAEQKYRVIYRVADDVNPAQVSKIAEDIEGKLTPGLLMTDDIGADLLAKASPESLKPLKAYILDAKQADDLFDYYNRALTPPMMQGFARVLPAFTRAYKAWALPVRPAFHYRNYISDKWQSMVMGMLPHEVVWHDLVALELRNAMAGATKEFDTMTSGLARGSVSGLKQGKKVTKHGRDLSDIFLRGTVAGDLTGEEVLLHAWNEGVLGSGFFSAEIFKEVFSRIPGKKPKLWESISDNWPTQKGYAFGHGLENWTRLSAFMWNLKKGKGPTEAAEVVRKYFFNYNDMPAWEKTLRSTAIPFWSWTRNNVPLQLRSLMEKPGITTAPFRAAHSAREQWDLSRDVEPDWISQELGVPMRRVKGPDGRDLTEYWFMASFLPPADLLRVGSVAMGYTKGAAGAFGLLPNDVQTRFALRGDVDFATKALMQNVNPAITQTIEKLTGFSLARLSKLKSERGGMTYIPYLGVYTTPETASLLAISPLLGELARLFKGEDRYGVEIPIGERISRVMLGSSDPPLPGGIYRTDTNENARFYRGRAQRGETGIRGQMRSKERKGELTEELVERFIERLGEHRRAGVGATLIGQ